MKYISTILLIVAIISIAFVSKKEKPVLYIIGDSTVRNGDGTGKNKQWGWGSVISSSFDTNRITIKNMAIGGRSSRTFITDGRWDAILKTLKKGDYVLMQFGHNDSSPLDDTARARGTIKGIGNDSVETYNPIRKMKEVVHTYGWYMRKFIVETKAKGATPVICTPIPRNNWKNGKIVRGNDDYVKWCKDLSTAEHAFLIDLNNRIADAYDVMDTTQVNSLFYGDHTHTSLQGAQLNAATVVEGIRDFKKCKLKKYLLKK